MGHDPKKEQVIHDLLCYPQLLNFNGTNRSTPGFEAPTHSRCSNLITFNYAPYGARAYHFAFWGSPRTPQQKRHVRRAEP